MRKNGHCLLALALTLAMPAISGHADAAEASGSADAAETSGHADAAQGRAAPSLRREGWQRGWDVPSPRGFVLGPSSQLRWRIFFIDPVVAAATTHGGFAELCSQPSHALLRRDSAAISARCALGAAIPVTGAVSKQAVEQGEDGALVSGFAMGFGAGYAVPTLLHYTGTNKSRPDLALSLSPGAPCIGACLKLAGSF